MTAPSCVARRATRSASTMLAVCSILCGGCYEFSRFDHLPLDGGVVSDAGGSDSGDGSVVDGGPTIANALIIEPFDVLDPSRWQALDGANPAFSIDDQQRVEGTGSLHVDVMALEQAGKADGLLGFLGWSGSTLPQGRGPRHLRFYARYHGAVDSTANFAVLAAPSNQGVAVGVTPDNSNVPSGGASLVLEEFPNNTAPTSFAWSPDTWHCVELAVLPANGGLWDATISIDGMPVDTMASDSLSKQVVYLTVGFGLTTATQKASDAWIDGVVLTDGVGTIGCSTH